MKLSIYDLWPFASQQLEKNILDHCISKNIEYSRKKITDAFQHEISEKLLSLACQLSQLYTGFDEKIKLYRIYEEALKNLQDIVISALPELICVPIDEILEDFQQNALAYVKNNIDFLLQLKRKNSENIENEMKLYYGDDFSTQFPALARSFIRTDTGIRRRSQEKISTVFFSNCPETKSTAFLEHLAFLDALELQIEKPDSYKHEF